MGGLILCRTKEAKNPYYIANMDLKIYSLEELCYYIYNNIYLIGVDLADYKLIEFIRNEIMETELADKLEIFMKEKAGLAEIVITILKYVDYYTISEIEQIREILASLDTQNVLERLKARADSFLGNKCYNSAIKNYNHIINSKKDKTLPGIFYAKVYHNTGVAYANLFLYKQAVGYFEEAYKIGQHEESLKCKQASEILAVGNDYEYADNLIENSSNVDDGELPIEETLNETEQKYVIKREIETLMDNAAFIPEYKVLDSIQEMKSEGRINESNSLMDEILDTWKNEYYKYTT